MIVRAAVRSAQLLTSNKKCWVLTLVDLLIRGQNWKAEKGEWRRIVSNGGGAGLFNDLPIGSRSRPTKTDVKVREMIKTYSNSMEGSLAWQWKHACVK